MLSLTLGDRSQMNEAIESLKSSQNLYDQIGKQQESVRDTYFLTLCIAARLVAILEIMRRTRLFSE